MKRIVFLIVLFLTILSGCSTRENSSSEYNSESSKSLGGKNANYCSFGAGNKWVYSAVINGRSTEFIQEVTSAETKEKKQFYTLESRSGGTVINKFKCCLEDNSLFLLKRMNARGETTFSPPRKEMICNAKVGDRWRWKSDNKNDYLNYETIKEEEITVPAGKFNTILVKINGFMNGAAINESYAWYSDKVGSIKEVVNLRGMTFVRELSHYNVN